jgi:hypothetical protein
LHRPNARTAALGSARVALRPRAALPACRPQFEMYESQWKGLMAQHKFVDAFHIFDEMLNGDKIDYPTYYANVTGMGSNYFNFEQSPDGCERSPFGLRLV